MAYLAIEDPFNWRKSFIPLAVKQMPTQTLDASLTKPSLPPTETPQGNSTPIPTETTTPTETQTPVMATTVAPITIAGDLTPTITVTASFEITPTLASLSIQPNSKVLLEDEFNDLQNWIAWGKPRATIQNGPGDHWLDLKAAEKSDQAGVTSRLEFANSSGTEVEFEAQLNSIFTQSPLLFDWDPVQFRRDAENLAPTTLHLQVQESLIMLQTEAVKNGCEIAIDGTTMHIYKLLFAADKKVELYLDRETTPRCTVDSGIDPIDGRITFTGNGWVTHLSIAQANAR